MLFSSSVFLFAFLPIVLLCYFGPLRGKRRGQNLFLLVASLLFYAWGEPWFVLIMMGSIGANYLFGLWVARRKIRKQSLKLPLVTAVAVNLGLLFIFKYLTFTLSSLRGLGLPVLLPVIELPIGISFFTFQAMSYVIDVARGHGEAQRSILNVGLYVSFFPQLIAGPIVKYETVADQIMNRQENWADFSAGISRFLMGLGKKVLLANQLAVVADAAFSAGTDLSVCFAWLGAIAYSLQIFLDFSGYSDMAIGLGKLFGFHFLENFNYPYLSTSITDFWRRWHISLGTWFRDYVYIPLGGNRTSKRAHIRNLFVVWLLTGIWHGANWTFVAWGLFYFVLLVLEKYAPLTALPPTWMRRCVTLLLVMVAWVLFRSDSLAAAWQYLNALVGVGSSYVGPFSVQAGYFFREYWMFFVGGILCCFPTATWLREKIKALSQGKLSPLLPAWDGLCTLGLVGIFLVSAAFLIKGTYNPFIYFNF